MAPTPDDDRLSRLLRATCGRCLQVYSTPPCNQFANNTVWERKRKPSQLHSDIYDFPARRVQILNYSVSAVFCAVLLVGAMACLRAISERSRGLGVGMVALSAFLFAAFVALFTDARRSEVFVGSAAYAEALVVYVSAGVRGTKQTQEGTQSGGVT